MLGSLEYAARKFAVLHALNAVGEGRRERARVSWRLHNIPPPLEHFLGRIVRSDDAGSETK